MTFGDIIAYFGALFGGIVTFLMFLAGVSIVIFVGGWIVFHAFVLFMMGLYQFLVWIFAIF